MITNDRQYRITNSQLSKLRKALEEFDHKQAVKRTGSQTLARAEFQALESQFQDLSNQVEEYQALKLGGVAVLEAKSLQDLPGILIKARIVRGLSQRRLAGKLRLKEQQIQRYEAENYASASLRKLAQVASALDLEISQIGELGSAVSFPVSKPVQELEWKRFPIDEMYRRNWFSAFSGSLAAARANAETLCKNFVQAVLPRPMPVFHRRHVRAKSVTDPYALLAWQCRILSLAKMEPLKAAYNKNIINQSWLKELARTSRLGDGPVRAKRFLRASGIHMVVEPRLSQTYLDGAALIMADGTPVVALTIRYDRLDNFWFVLFHEVTHVAKHFRTGYLNDFFDDLDSEPDQLEKEADRLAGDALIPDENWETALARYVRSVDSVNELAKELRIHPAIVAGRIRKEANNYTILNDLVGQGRVREHFREVSFGQ